MTIFEGSGLRIVFEAHPSVLRSKEKEILAICVAADDMFFIYAQKQRIWLNGYLKHLSQERRVMGYWYFDPNTSQTLEGDVACINDELKYLVGIETNMIKEWDLKPAAKFLYDEVGEASHLIMLMPLKVLFPNSVAFGDLSIVVLRSLHMSLPDLEAFCNATDGVSCADLAFLDDGSPNAYSQINAHNSLRKLRNALGVKTVGKLISILSRSL